MAVNYLGYAQASNRNPIAEGLSSLGETLDKNAAMKRQAAIDARQASLADIQLQREQMALADMQREQQYKQGLRAAMASPQTTTQFTPRQPEASPQAGMQSLRSVIMPNVGTPPDGLRNDMVSERLAPEFDASGFSMPQPQASPAVQAYNEGRVKTTAESPSAAGARYAISQGRPEEAAKMISVDDALAQFAAKVQAGGGDPKQYYAAKADLDQSKEAFEIIKNFKGQPDLLKAMWPAFIKAYPKAAGIDPTSIIFSSEGVLVPLRQMDGTPVPGKSYFYDNQGKMHLVEDKQETQEKWSEPYMDKVGGKTVMLQKSSTGQIKPVVQDTSTTVKVSTGNRSGHTEFKDVMALRKEFSSLPEVKDYSMIQAQSLRAKKALEESLSKNSNMPVDQTVITTFNKLLDPSSVVRESEYARTPQDLSILSRIKGKWDKVQRGGAGLDLSERQALVRMIGNFSEIADQQYNDQVQQYTELARRNGFDPGDVIRLGHNKPKQSGGSQSSFTTKGGFIVRPK